MEHGTHLFSTVYRDRIHFILLRYIFTIYNLYYSKQQRLTGQTGQTQDNMCKHEANKEETDYPQSVKYFALKVHLETARTSHFPDTTLINLQTLLHFETCVVCC